jgi:hypothetical protein
LGIGDKEDKEDKGDMEDKEDKEGDKQNTNVLSIPNS